MSSGLSRPGEFDQPAAEATGQRSVSSVEAAPAATAALPYRPSWIDRLTGWVQRLPLPAWAFYLALGLGLTLLIVLISWAEGVLAHAPPVAVIVYNLLLGMTYAYFLALIHYLDNSAESALVRFRPVMAVDDAGYETLRYRLTTLPAGPTLLAAAVGAVYAVATVLLSVFMDAGSGIEEIPLVVIVSDVILRILIYALVAVVVYHTLHQLRMVNAIYTRHTRINIFEQGPLYTLSSLTARTAIGIAIPTYLWFQADTLLDSSTSAADIFETVFLGIVVLITFIWPLWGAHTLLEKEKQRLKDEVARRIEATIAVLHRSVDTADMQHRGELKETMEALVAEQGVVDKLRTWPWQTGTVSGLGLAFLVPIIIWVVQRLLERLGI
jgi:hypothetical protein